MLSKNIRLLAGLLLPLALLGGCRQSSHTGRASGSHQGIDHLTSTEVYTYDLPEGADEFSLTLEIRPGGGSFAWSVLDPQGQVFWEGSLEEGQNVREKRDLPREAGEWSLHVQLENASGDYEFEWESRR